MEEIQTVCRYLDRLKQRYGLFLSLHPLRPETLIGQSELLRYNMHENPYCIFLKSCAGVWNHCVERQEKLLPGLQNGPYCGACFAGVREYIYPIRRGKEIIGFISAGCARLPGGEARLQRVCREYGVDYNKLSALYQKLPEELPPREEMDTLILPLCDMFQLRYLQEAGPGELPGGEDAFFDRLLHFIQMNHTRKITLDELCERFFCSKSYISHRFKQTVGMNINEYMNHLRMEDAARLLRSSSLSVTEIALSLGFSDGNYFSTCFRRAWGVSPRAYRTGNRRGGKLPHDTSRPD